MEKQTSVMHKLMKGVEETVSKHQGQYGEKKTTGSFQQDQSGTLQPTTTVGLRGLKPAQSNGVVNSIFMELESSGHAAKMKGGG